MTPGPPLVKVNGNDLPPKNDTIGPFDESTTMSLECTTVGGRPPPEVRWYNGSKVMRSKVTSGGLESLTQLPKRLLYIGFDDGLECDRNRSLYCVAL